MKTFREFLPEIARQAKPKTHLNQTLSHSQPETLMQKNTLEKYRVELIDTLIRTTSSKQAFQLINRSTNHPPDKTRRWSDELPHDLVMTTGIVVGQLKVLLSCLHQLQLISGKASPMFIQYCTFPDLPPLHLQDRSRYCNFCVHPARASRSMGFLTLGFVAPSDWI